MAAKAVASRCAFIASRCAALAAFGHVESGEAWIALSTRSSFVWVGNGLVRLWVANMTVRYLCSVCAGVSCGWPELGPELLLEHPETARAARMTRACRRV